jgi:hypothetical protein
MGTHRSDRLLGGVGATIGVALGLWIVLVFMTNGPAPLNPVQYVVIYQQPPVPGVDAELHVELFGIWRYSRIAPQPQDFETEWSYFVATPGTHENVGRV